MNIKAQSPFRVMSYNLENLFDTIHDDLKDDYDFLPNGEKKWTKSRYWRKLNSLTKVVSAISETRLPDIIACNEVENERVLYDWTSRSVMRNLGYKFVVSSSSDSRGIDVALLYQPGSFRLADIRTIKVPSIKFGYKSTRDILYVKGKILSGDTLHIIICHFPSRGGRTIESTAHRMLAAKTLRSISDSILIINPKSLIITLGDFNATPSDKIFKECICSGYNGLYLLKPYVCRKWEPYNVLGSYRYRGHWEHIDHILLSKSFLEQESNLQLKKSLCDIFALPFMLEKDETYGGLKPYRTYQGPIYKGGYSDHLPILADFIIMK